MKKYKEYINARKLPPIPSTVKPLPIDVEGKVKAMVLAGLNLIGEKGYICPTVTIISSDEISSEVFGWSLCLGNPNSQTDDEPYYFRTSKKEGASTAKGTEIPNSMVYFQAEVDAELASPEADPQKLEKVIAYVLPYISDGGPPPSEGKSFNELVAEMSTSGSEQKQALALKDQVNSLFDRAKQELTGELDYWKLLDELNLRLYESGLNYAWKNDSLDHDFNPDLGVIKKTVAGRLVTVSIGLSKDRFAGPCAVVQIVDD